MKRKARVYLVAGGTGGHINGALALGEKLSEFDLIYISSNRDIDKSILKNEQAWFLNAKALRGRSLFSTLLNIFFNMIVFIQVFFKTIFHRPEFAIGLGGFICGPTLAACYILGIPVYVVEQNSVMGLANKLLLPLSKKVFTHFHKTHGLPIKFQNKVVVSGNPIRSAIKYTTKIKDKNHFHLLVFGGSLGAKEINHFIEKIFTRDSEFCISIKHQVGVGHNTNFIPGANIEYQQVSYIDNIQQSYDWADMIICRGGASTISELRIVRRPVLIFPYNHSDQHQKINGEFLKEKSDFPVWVLNSNLSDTQKIEDINKAIIEAREFVIKKTETHCELDPRDIILNEIGVVQ